MFHLSVVPSTGCYVYARLPGDADVYLKAVVVEKNLKRVYVKFFSGKKQGYNVRDFAAVLWNIDPKPTDLRVGTLVIVADEEHGSVERMIRARIREIKTNSRKRTSYLVDIFDGRSIWTVLSKIRVLPESDVTGIISGFILFIEYCHVMN